MIDVNKQTFNQSPQSKLTKNSLCEESKTNFKISVKLYKNK